MVQFEVGAGFIPAGGPMARLSRLVGRGRALEILLVADDFDGPRAEQYGYVNRTISDDARQSCWSTTRVTSALRKARRRFVISDASRWATVCSTVTQRKHMGGGTSE